LVAVKRRALRPQKRLNEIASISILLLVDHVLDDRFYINKKSCIDKVDKIIVGNE